MAEKFTCQACGASFTAKDELETHNKKEHMKSSQPIGGQQKKG